ncbi:hypothetical protein M885DRAFT_521472 [Pelagophyceae sp. CCMP2097]|nr:hypothetical protein M885DRAFT_521472 [Pelagophyceae sp. CCMP2097]
MWPGGGPRLSLLMGIFASRAASAGPSPIVSGAESLMAKKAHGSCANAPQAGLRFGCDAQTADNICCFNRHYAEHSGYFLTTSFAKQTQDAGTTTYYDSVSGAPLFRAPVGRSYAAFLKESKAHGWPSFRDEEVVWDNVRVLRNGEAVSVSGTHLGHNLPDRSGNRYCINLVSVAGRENKAPTGDTL